MMIIYQFHATIFSTDSITESDETSFFLKRVNVMDLEKRKEVYEYVKNVMNQVQEKDDDSSDINTNFLNEIEYHISNNFHCSNVISCHGITQDPITKDYMMVYVIVIYHLLGMCQPVNYNQEKSVKKGVYGVLPYTMAPEVILSVNLTFNVSECLDVKLSE
ncbi:kinase-like domain-containing protein [Rhizophagus irregularis DAOM 181602=DAOM 197198]|nr:kinase-like domain-containing protein [Rhizophagus irregularis DAOM 181602=DAOM 197198]